MNYRKFTGEKLSSLFLARMKEWYPNDNPLKSSKDSVIFKDITKTPTKQNNIDRFVLQYKMTEEQPTQQEIECYEDKLEEKSKLSAARKNLDNYILSMFLDD